MRSYKGKLSVLMPAHNEGGWLYSNVMETQGVLEEAEVDYEIVVIDDGSGDNTLLEAQRAEKENNRIKVCHSKKNQGKGWALKEGFRHSQGDLVVFLDSDLDLHPSQMEVFFDLMNQEESHVVIGSKRHPLSKIHYPMHRKVISVVYFFLVKLLFGLPIRDTQTGMKMFKREVLEQVFPRVVVKRFAFDLEVLALAHRYGYRISEAPVVVDFKVRLGQLIGPGIILKTFWDTMALFFRMRLLKAYDQQEP